MASLLVTTPHYVLRYDLAEKKCYVIEEGRGLYYGASWFKGGSGLLLSHSGTPGIGALASVAEYQRSEVGYVSQGANESWRFLSNPHQLRCIQAPFVAATNTGRNAITILDSSTWSTRQVRFDDIYWDRYDPHGPGSHFNSIEFDGQTLHVLAHNFDRGSYEVALDWPSLRVLGRVDHKATQLHNLWVLPNGQRLACDSPNGGLIDLSTDSVLWSSNDPNCYTRGLACIGEDVFIGASEKDLRDDRAFGHPGIWAVDRVTWTTKEFIDLGWMGVVLEIRALDVLDECHPVGPLTLDAYLTGTPLDTYRALPQSIASVETLRQTALRRRAFLAETRERDEALAQHRRLADERHAMLLERDAAITERDEAWAQYKRVSGERVAMMEERDAAITARDEAFVQQKRLAHERDTMVKARDAALRRPQPEPGSNEGGWPNGGRPLSEAGNVVRETPIATWFGRAVRWLRRRWPARRL